ncbi:MAG: gliding motility protein GldN [Bacteroidetes bacterium]|nr:MAG: gliding motility protein GldN [Bacteroidota bacterium]
MLKTISYGLLLLCLVATLQAQDNTTPIGQRNWLEGGSRNTHETTPPPLTYPETRPADILWEKRIWREVDTREKLNLVFRSPEHSLFELIQQGIKTGAVQVYRPIDDHFTTPFTAAEIEAQFNQTDTIIVRDPETGEYYSQVITNEFDPARIKRWRLQEVWYFDARYGGMRVRILGLAPILDSYDEEGQTVRYSSPMFWINYKQARTYLASHPIFNAGNDKTVLSWDDLFQMRRFSSYVYRESDLLGRRLQDYATGVKLLQKSQQIDDAMLNREMDSWSY